MAAIEQLPGVDIIDRDFLNKVIGLMLFRDVDDELSSVFQKVTDVDFWDISLGDTGDSKTYRTLLKIVTSLRLQGHSPHVIKEKLCSHQGFASIISDVELNKDIYDTYDTLEVLKNKIKTFLLYRFLVDCNQNITGKLVSGKIVDDSTFSDTIKKIEGLYSSITFDHISSESTYSDAETIDSRFQQRIDKIVGKKHGYIIPTGIELVDATFNNLKGMEAGCIYMISAPYGLGKTRFITAIGANSYINGYNTYHVTIENKKEQVEALYDISLTGVTIEEIYNILIKSLDDEMAKKELAVIKSILKDIYTSRKNILEIKKFQAYKTSSSLIENFIKRKMSSGSPKPDLLIVDHMDIMIPNQGFISDLFQRGELIVGELKDLAERYMCAILVPTQIGREGVKNNRTNKNSATSGGESVSRSLAKNELVDFHATLNQNDDENVKNLMRIFIDKNREGWGRVVIPVGFDKGRLRITSLTKENELIDFDETIVMHVNRLLVRAGKSALKITHDFNLTNFSDIKNNLSCGDSSIDDMFSQQPTDSNTVIEIPDNIVLTNNVPNIVENSESFKSVFNETETETNKSSFTNIDDVVGILKFDKVSEWLNYILKNSLKYKDISSENDMLYIKFIDNIVSIDYEKVTLFFDALNKDTVENRHFLYDKDIIKTVLEFVYDGVDDVVTEELPKDVD